MMNRQQLRRVQHLPAAQFYQIIANVVEEEAEKQKGYAFNNLAACMFTALRERFPAIMTGEMMHSIALDVVELSHGIEGPSELDAILYEQTGFSIYEPPSQSSLKYIPKGEQYGNDKP